MEQHWLITKRSPENDSELSIVRYQSPKCDWGHLSAETLLCVSPDNGGLENVSYEDWVE